MSKWRPTKDGCIYVIPDIHGSIDLLELILARILPLRKKKDKIVFLGDYMDYTCLGHEVLDRLIKLKEEYGERVVCLKGNHEDMLLKGLQYIPYGRHQEMYDMWMEFGGEETIIGYLDRAGEELTWGALPKRRVKDLIPQEHIQFMKSCPPYYETDDFIFVHGGCDPTKPIQDQSHGLMMWDRGLFSLAQRAKRKGIAFDHWQKIIVTGHNGHKNDKPFIYGKYMMLDIKGVKKLFVVEVNSMEAFVAKKGNDRLVKFEL